MKDEADLPSLIGQYECPHNFIPKAIVNQTQLILYMYLYNITYMYGKHKKVPVWCLFNGTADSVYSRPVPIQFLCTILFPFCCTGILWAPGQAPATCIIILNLD